MNREYKIIPRIILGLCLLSFSAFSYASLVVYEDAQLVNANSKNHIGYFNDSFHIAEAGVYQAVLTDFEFPKKFTKLGMVITSSTETMGKVCKTGGFEFNAEVGDYFIGLYYQTKPKFDLGMYGIEISRLSPASVPLPAALWMFISGLMALGIYKKGG